MEGEALGLQEDRHSHPAAPVRILWVPGVLGDTEDAENHKEPCTSKQHSSVLTPNSGLGCTAA